MMSSNGNIFSVTGFLCGEFTGHRWIPLTKASDTELWFFFDPHLNEPLNKQSRHRWFDTLSRPLWRHCDENISSYRNPSWISVWNQELFFGAPSLWWNWTTTTTYVTTRLIICNEIVVNWQVIIAAMLDTVPYYHAHTFVSHFKTRELVHLWNPLPWNRHSSLPSWDDNNVILKSTVCSNFMAGKCHIYHI